MALSPEVLAEAANYLDTIDQTPAEYCKSVCKNSILAAAAFADEQNDDEILRQVIQSLAYSFVKVFLDEAEMQHVLETLGDTPDN